MENESFDFAVAATTAVPFTAPTIPNGIAAGVFVTATLSGGLTLTRPDGTTVVCGLQTIGTYVRFRCKMATFSAGTCIAYA